MRQCNALFKRWCITRSCDIIRFQGWRGEHLNVLMLILVAVLEIFSSLWCNGSVVLPSIVNQQMISHQLSP